MTIMFGLLKDMEFDGQVRLLNEDEPMQESDLLVYDDGDTDYGFVGVSPSNLWGWQGSTPKIDDEDIDGPNQWIRISVVLRIE